MSVKPGERFQVETELATGEWLQSMDSNPEGTASPFPYVNPTTGPVYIEGTKPGDMLVVHVEKIEVEDLGYTPVDSLEEADFIPVPTLLMTKSDQTVYYGPGWWWGGYYPSWGWGWGFYWKSTDYWYPVYPWYPPAIPVTVSTYFGTIVYEMVDAASYRAIVEWNQQNPGQEEGAPEMEINWQAQIQGYSTDDGSYNQERAVRGTDEAFAQSPYLIK